MERVDAAGREPYTWVRTQGKGRVFYTAYGHDERTWGNPGFLQLVAERHRVGGATTRRAPAWQRLKMPAVEYVDGFNVPNYEKRDPAPKYQLPMTPADSQKFIQTPAEFKVELFAQEPMLGGKPITFSFDERGRLWVDRGRRLSEPRAARRAGRRPHPHPRGHQRRRQGRQGHRLRRPPEPADQPGLRQRRRHRLGRAAHAVPAGHQRRRQGRREEDPQHRLGHHRHARRALEPELRPRQLRLGHGRLLRLRRRR